VRQLKNDSIDHADMVHCIKPFQTSAAVTGKVLDTQHGLPR